jgi:hypothetical protein
LSAPTRFTLPLFTVVMPAKYLALSAIVFLACSFSPTPVAALSVDSHGLQARHAHIGQAFAKRAPKRCKARTPQAVGDPTTSSTTPAATPAIPNQNTPAPPANTPAPSGYSPKGCLAIADGAFSLATLAKFKTPQVSTFYTWSPWKISGFNDLGYQFVPMYSHLDQQHDFNEQVIAGLGNHILGFNEPDMEGLYHIDPWAAAARWKDDIKPKKALGYQLISPALSSAPGSIQWMHNFIGACGEDCVDKIAVHWYGIHASEFISYLQLWHETFQRNIWVTEFACTNFAGTEKCPDIPGFAHTVKEFMDNTPWVEHYCPFVVSNDMKDVEEGNRLYDYQGNPTDLARIYFGYP